VNFLTGITNLTNWLGNVIMPTLAAIFFVISVIRFARHAPFQYSMYARCAALIVSGILRGLEKFSQQRAWNDPDAVWVTWLGLVNWAANVFLRLYGVLQVIIAILHYGGMGFRLYPGTLWARHLLAAMACFGLSGLLRLAEFFVAQGTGSELMALEVTPVHRNLHQRVTYLYLYLEFEDLFIVIDVAAVRNVAGRFLKRELYGVPLNIVLQYVVPIVAVP